MLLLIPAVLLLVQDTGSEPAVSMPCCLESLGISACTRLKNHKTSWFKRKCENSADFALVQCCHTCETNMQEVGQRLFARGDRSPQCFDRHKYDFCRAFVDRTHGWDEGGRVSCGGEGAALAFRICRKTCGFCDVELYRRNITDTSCPVIG